MRFHRTEPLHVFLRSENVCGHVWKTVFLFTLELHIILRSLATYLRTERFPTYVFISRRFGERSKRKTTFADNDCNEYCTIVYSIKITYNQRVTCVLAIPQARNKSVKIIYLLEIVGSDATAMSPGTEWSFGKGRLVRFRAFCASILSILRPSSGVYRFSF